MPRKNKKAPKHNRSKGSSFIGRMNSIISSGFGEGGKREVIVKLAIMSRKSCKNAAVLILQPKPTSGIIR